MANADQPSQRTSHPSGIPDASTRREDAQPNEDRLVREGDDKARVEGGYVQRADPAYDEHRDAGTRTSRPDGRSGVNEDKPDRRNDAGPLAERG